MEAAQVSIDRCVDKEDNGVIYMHVYLCTLRHTPVCIYVQQGISYKKEWNNAICSNIDELRHYRT